MQLAWSDEFNYTGLPDTNKWNYDTGGWGWGNNELQYYTKDSLGNARVANGLLTIELKKQAIEDKKYSSARLVTKGKGDWIYGRIDVRAKLPKGLGTWPAIWMLGKNIIEPGAYWSNSFGNTSWPACGEIDIVEHRGSELNKIFGTLHYPGRSGGNPDGSTKVIANATTEFHIYTVEWYADAIKIYVDNQLFHTVANSANIPFNHDYFLLVNMAMGGTFGGAVESSFNAA